MSNTLTNAEIELRTSQLEWPTIHYTRIRALESLLTTSNYFWRNGKIVPHTTSKKYKEIKRKLKKGTAPTVEEALLERELERAQEELVRNPNSEKTAEDIASYHVDAIHQGAEVPHRFYLTNVSNMTVIRSIPDDVEPDFLSLCVEYLEAALQAKIDFTEKTILDARDLRYHFGESGEGLNERELEVRTKLSKVLTEILAEAEGTPFPPTPEKAKKDLEKWNNHYSPAARARRANSDNEDCRKAAAGILANLRERNLIS